MSNFIEIKPEDLSGNIIDRINNDWMLITAKKDGAVNAMTASWGQIGELWNQPVAICYIRPQRYTLEFTESGDFLTLTFFDRNHHEKLSYFGTHSGRDGDKFAATGLTPIIDGDYAYAEEANTVLFCRKLYADYIKKENFLSDLPLVCYPKSDFHKFYICKIEKVWVRNKPSC